jgi:flagellin
MIGGLHASIGTALRSAVQARGTADTMARQIATGQKVASARDNGAVWVISQSLVREANASEVRATLLDRTASAAAGIRMGGETIAEGFAQLKDIIHQAMGFAPGG